MNLTESWKQYLEEIADPENLDVSSFEIQDTLQPDIWESEEKLNQEISARLYEIAKEFFKSLDLDWVTIVDITITGSIANYTWSKYSDIDLHIIIDYKEVDENQELVQNYLRRASSLWNKNHDIFIKGFEVEVYVQDSNESHYSTGVYSVKYDRWDTKPSRIDPKIDYENVQKKAALLMDKVDEVYDIFKEGDYEAALDQADSVRDKIRKFRQSGLETGGAFSVENLAFKLLRRTDYLERLSSLRIQSYDKSMSINGEKI
jgi:predicted nucleotidyltransferase